MRGGEVISMKLRLGLMVAGVLALSSVCGCAPSNATVSNVSAAETSATTQISDEATTLILTGAVVANSGAEIIVQADYPESKMKDGKNIQDFYILKFDESVLKTVVDGDKKLIGFREVEVGTKIGFGWESDAEDYSNSEVTPTSIWYLADN